MRTPPVTYKRRIAEINNSFTFTTIKSPLNNTFPLLNSGFEASRQFLADIVFWPVICEYPRAVHTCAPVLMSWKCKIVWIPRTAFESKRSKPSKWIYLKRYGRDLRGATLIKHVILKSDTIFSFTFTFSCLLHQPLELARNALTTGHVSLTLLVGASSENKV